MTCYVMSSWNCLTCLGCQDLCPGTIQGFKLQHGLINFNQKIPNILFHFPNLQLDIVQNTCGNCPIILKYCQNIGNKDILTYVFFWKVPINPHMRVDSPPINPHLTWGMHSGAFGGIRWSWRKLAQTDDGPRAEGSTPVGDRAPSHRRRAFQKGNTLLPEEDVSGP